MGIASQELLGKIGGRLFLGVAGKMSGASSQDLHGSVLSGTVAPSRAAPRPQTLKVRRRRWLRCGEGSVVGRGDEDVGGIGDGDASERGGGGGG